MKRVKALFIISLFVIFLFTTKLKAQLQKSSYPFETLFSNSSIYIPSFFLNNPWLNMSIPNDSFDLLYKYPSFPIEQIKFPYRFVFDPFGLYGSLNKNSVYFDPDIGFIYEQLHHYCPNPFYYSTLSWEYIWSPRDALTTASDNSKDIAIPHSMKGYELYSWPVDSEWCFTLITGTNRIKTFEEITSTEDIIAEDGWVKITVQGVESIKKIMDQLPKGESVFWISEEWLEQVQGEAGTIALPNEAIMNDIRMYCEQLNIDLHIALGSEEMPPNILQGFDDILLGLALEGR